MFSAQTTGFARLVHTALVQNPTELVVVGDGAGYATGTALTEFDGSSKYVVGGLTSLPGKKGESLASQVLTARGFVQENGLPGQLYLGHRYLGDGTRIETALLASGDLRPQIKRHVIEKKAHAGDDALARAGLLHLAEYLEQARGVKIIDGEVSLSTEDQAVAQDSRLAEIVQANTKAAQDLMSVLEQDPAMQLLIGESFTFGKIASLLGGVAARPHSVGLSYGWYHPQYKRAMGVNPDQLANEKIAEPETVKQGVRGLLARANEKVSPYAIATSGWANNSWLGDKVDYFSVAVGNRAVINYLRYRVTSTAEDPIGRTRRAITRELGVTAALYLLSDTYMPQSSMRPGLKRLKGLLKKYGA